MRFAIRLLFLLVALFLIAPFFLSSVLTDQRGVTVPSHVVHKDEYIVEQYSSWNRRMDVSLTYDPPDVPGVAFLKVRLTSEQRFDNLKKGDLVQLHYLRQADLPDLPGLKTMWQMRVLSFVRLADQDTWSGVRDLMDAHSSITAAVLMAGLLLWLWKLLRIPFFAWPVAACVLSAIAALIFSEFPRPTPKPQIYVRRAEGVVKSLSRWEWIFRDNHERGLEADQPIQIVAIQFLPKGRLEPVVAVDLIDDDSTPGLYEKAPVTVEYESDSPRVAYLTGATRHFAQKNLKGILMQGLASLVVILVLWTGFHLLTRHRQPTR